MADTPALITPKQQAVLLGSMMIIRQEGNVDYNAQIIKYADMWLQTHFKERITPDEVNETLMRLVANEHIHIDDTGFPEHYQIWMDRTELRFDNDIQRAQFLGTDVVFLKNAELDGIDDTFGVEFNYNGKGGKRFYDGTTTSDSLSKISADCRHKHGIVKGDSSGVQNWYVDLQYHPDAPQQKTKRRFRVWLRLLDEAEPHRRLRITR